MPAPRPGLLEVGRIARAHGLTGEVDHRIGPGRGSEDGIPVQDVTFDDLHIDTVKVAT